MPAAPSWPSLPGRRRFRLRTAGSVRHAARRMSRASRRPPRAATGSAAADRRDAASCQDDGHRPHATGSLESTRVTYNQDGLASVHMPLGPSRLHRERGRGRERFSLPSVAHSGTIRHGCIGPVVRQAGDGAGDALAQRPARAVPSGKRRVGMPRAPPANSPAGSGQWSEPSARLASAPGSRGVWPRLRLVGRWTSRPSVQGRRQGGTC